MVILNKPGLVFCSTRLQPLCPFCQGHKFAIVQHFIKTGDSRIRQQTIRLYPYKNVIEQSKINYFFGHEFQIELLRMVAYDKFIANKIIRKWNITVQYCV